MRKHLLFFILHPSSLILFLWRGARVVELAALEMLCTGNRTVGSNPTLSALKSEVGCRMLDVNAGLLN